MSRHFDSYLEPDLDDELESDEPDLFQLECEINADKVELFYNEY